MVFVENKSSLFSTKRWKPPRLPEIFAGGGWIVPKLLFLISRVFVGGKLTWSKPKLVNDQNLPVYLWWFCFQRSSNPASKLLIWNFWSFVMLFWRSFFRRLGNLAVERQIIKLYLFSMLIFAPKKTLHTCLDNHFQGFVGLIWNFPPPRKNDMEGEK